jgi:hypothetical protein
MTIVSVQKLTRLLKCLMLAVLCLAFAQPELLLAQEFHPAVNTHVDTDKDGFSDELEQLLLQQFAPRFMVSRSDCSSVPAEFVAGLGTPNVASENATIYGQVFPAKRLNASKPLAEVHFYHLWKQDCGANGHPLDAEHVSVLVQASETDLSAARWQALYWFAAAHQNTVCDVSQIARASALRAEHHGASVWISVDKHASFLSQALCKGGCGHDQCERMEALPISNIINVGETGQPMNGSLWINSPRWPLAAKMNETDFPHTVVGRLNEHPLTEIAWFHEGRHPAQGVIAISSATAEALGGSSENTVNAISLASEATGNAVEKSYSNTLHALGSSATHVRKFLRFQ